MDKVFALLICAACALLACAPPPAAAQSIQRCTGSDGVSVFTDRSCDALAASPRLARRPSAAHDTPTASPAMFSRHCPQRLSQLVEQIQSAIHSGDINRLSALYWWAGQDNAAASQQLQRLEAIVERPLLDIAPVYAGPATVADSPLPPPLPALIPFPDNTQAADQHATDSAAPPPALATAPPLRQRPVGLRLEQHLRNSATASRSVLRLRRQYGCFWISF